MEPFSLFLAGSGCLAYLTRFAFLSRSSVSNADRSARILGFMAEGLNAFAVFSALFFAAVWGQTSMALFLSFVWFAANTAMIPVTTYLSRARSTPTPAPVFLSQTPGSIEPRTVTPRPAATAVFNQPRARQAQTAQDETSRIHESIARLDRQIQRLEQESAGLVA